MVRHLKVALLALAFLAGSLTTAAVGQAPPPIPALPDVGRSITYTPSASTGPFALPFPIYGDGTDYQNWVEVWLNGVKLTPVTDWTLNTASGTLATLSRPITNAQVTLNAAATGTLTIIGARRPRRTSQFQTSPTVRDFNQVLTDLTAQNRESWDRFLRALSTDPAGTAYDASGRQIRNLSNPSVGSDAANVDYVSAAINSLNTAVVASIDANFARTLRSPNGETFNELPSLASRLGTGGSGTILGFDGVTGQPVATLLTNLPAMLVGSPGSAGNILVSNGPLATPTFQNTIVNTVNITPPNDNKGINIVQGNFTGGTYPATDYTFNSFEVNPDSVNATRSIGLWSRLRSGGATAQGQRVAIRGMAGIEYPSTQTNGDVIGVSGWAIADHTNGGVPGTPRGTLYGMEPAAFAFPGATDYLVVSGMEVDASIIGTATAANRWGISIVGIGDKRGYTQDAGLQFGAAASAGRYLNAILLSNGNGLAPLDTDGCVLCTDGSAVTISTGINLSSYTITGNFLAGPNGFTVDGNANLVTATGAFGKVGGASNAIQVKGTTSGLGAFVSPAALGSATWNLPTNSGTLVVSASSPLAVTPATGNITCATCVTSSGGGAITGTAPVAVSAAGAVSITGVAGRVLAGASPAFTATPTLGVAGSAIGTLALAGNTSGTVTITPQAAAGTATFTLPNASGTPAISVPTPLLLSATTGAVTWAALTSGGVLYASGTTSVASSSLLTANAIMLGGGAGVAPATMGSLGTATTVLHGNAAGSPSFAAVTGGDMTNNTVGNAQLRQSAALSVVGNSTNTTANVGDIAAASDNQIMRRSGTAIGFGSIDISQSNAVGSSILAKANGGCGTSGGGTWTPALAFGGASVGITYSTQLGRYEQCGDILVATVNVVLTSKGSSTGAATVTGLPVSCSSTIGAATVSFYSGMSSMSAPTGAATGSGINLYNASTTASSALSDVNFSNTSNINVTAVCNLN